MSRAEIKTEANKARVQVRNLPKQEKELKDGEAENIKGGGGLAGGVVPTSREEIPQTQR